MAELVDALVSGTSEQFVEVRVLSWARTLARARVQLEPVADIHEAVRSFAKTGFHENFVVASQQRMDPDLVVPRRRLEIDRKGHRGAVGPVNRSLKVVELLDPAGADIRLDNAGVVADPEGRGVRRSPFPSTPDVDDPRWVQTAE